VAVHVARVAAREAPQETGDHGLGPAFPILYDQCAESIVRLEHFNMEQWRLEDSPIRRWRPEATFDRDGLDEHARALLRCVQRELAARSSPLSPGETYELNHPRKIALEALYRLGGNRYAKAVHAELAAPGAPRAICVGTGYVQVVAGRRFIAEGCRAIFEDAPFGRGNMWPSWCPDCRPKNGRRNPSRDQARAFKRWLSAPLGPSAVDTSSGAV
jgi:hypothetical protein